MFFSILCDRCVSVVINPSRRILQGFLEIFRLTEADASVLLSAYGLHALEIDRLQQNRLNEQKATSRSSEKINCGRQIGPLSVPIPIGIHPDFISGNWKAGRRKHVHR